MKKQKKSRGKMRQAHSEGRKSSKKRPTMQTWSGSPEKALEKSEEPIE